MVRFQRELDWRPTWIARNPTSQEFINYSTQQLWGDGVLPERTEDLISLTIQLRCTGWPSGTVYAHDLHLIDPPGEYINGPSDSQQYFKELYSSDAIICMLDGEHREIGPSAGLSPLIQFHRPGQYLVVCLGRSDVYYSYGDVFGADTAEQRKHQIAKIAGKEIVNSLENLYGAANTYYCLTSSVGWVRAVGKGIYFPNRTAMIGRDRLVIYRPASWRPWYVLEPFFWLLGFERHNQHPRMTDKTYLAYLGKFWSWWDVFAPNFRTDFREWLAHSRSRP